MNSLRIILHLFLPLLCLPLFGEELFGAPEGDWVFEDNRLYQRDAHAPRAKLWMAVEQSGSTIYEFTLRYEGGLEDGHGGVGIHILGEGIPQGKSWGLGSSYLLWLNYDETPANSHIPAGWSVQLYQSQSNEEMILLASESAPVLLKQLMENQELHVQLIYHSEESTLHIKNPNQNTTLWVISLPESQERIGHFVALRTNGLSASFTVPYSNKSALPHSVKSHSSL